jgi:uncharacterized Zn-finger protein
MEQAAAIDIPASAPRPHPSHTSVRQELHGPGKRVASMSKCPVCNLVFSRKEHLTRHQRARRCSH